MRTFFAILGMLVVLHLQAQTPEAPNAISGKFLFIDHYTPYLDGKLASMGQMTRGMEIGYTRWINRSLNLHFPARLGMADLPNPDGLRVDKPWFNLDATLQLKLFDNTKFINPYLVGGIGVVLTNWEDWSPQAPVGAGINFRLDPNFYINTQAEYRWDFAKDAENLHYTIGGIMVLGEIKKKPVDTDGDGLPDLEDKCPLVPGPVQLMGCPDTDGDGIADMDDACPDVPGVAALNGCPDTDGDGITDAEDACPGEAGPAATHGCPDRDHDGLADADDACPDQAGPANMHGCPDRDNDGVADKDDLCPDVPGVASNNGCPSDRDKDGVADVNDRCPDEAGPASNKGCPELKPEEKAVVQIAIQNVQFQSNSAVLTKESLPLLDKLVTVLKDHPAYHCGINGHTDSTGDDAYNQALSESRAKACFDYLVDQGIQAERLTHNGYGETKPLADNGTAEGRRANRRVEFDLQVK